MKENRRCDYDVIIAGAGPAGGVLAYELASQGLEVLVLEKEKLPRYKPCGGGLTMKAAKLIGFDVSEVYDRSMADAIMSYRNKDEIIFKGNKPMGWMVMRDKLDYAILQRAIIAGAKVIDTTPVMDVKDYDGAGLVKVLTKDEEYRAQILVGADGVNSTVSNSVGLRKRKRIGVALAGEIFVDDQAMSRQDYAQFDFGNVPKGYAWIFPKKNHLSIGVFSSEPKVPKLKSILMDFIKMHENLSGYKELRTAGHLIPLGGIDETLHQGRVLLLGDAGGLVDPFWGEGIYYALESAKIASEVIVGALTVGDIDLRLYTEKVLQEIVPDFRYARIFAQIFYAFPWLSFKLIVENQSVSNLMTSILRGDLTYKGYTKILTKNIFRIIAGKPINNP